MSLRLKTERDSIYEIVKGKFNHIEIKKHSVYIEDHQLFLDDFEIISELNDAYKKAFHSVIKKTLKNSIAHKNEFVDLNDILHVTKLIDSYKFQLKENSSFIFINHIQQGSLTVEISLGGSFFALAVFILASTLGEDLKKVWPETKASKFIRSFLLKILIDEESNKISSEVNDKFMSKVFKKSKRITIDYNREKREYFFIVKSKKLENKMAVISEYFLEYKKLEAKKSEKKFLE